MVIYWWYPDDERKFKYVDSNGNFVVLATQNYVNVNAKCIQMVTPREIFLF